MRNASVCGFFCCGVRNTWDFLAYRKAETFERKYIALDFGPPLKVENFDREQINKLAVCT